MDKIIINRQLTQRFLFYLSITLIFILTSVIYEGRVLRHLDPESVFEKFQDDFSEASLFLENSLTELADEKYIADNSLADEKIRTINGPLQLFFFKFINDSLVYWSDNSVPIFHEISQLSDSRIVDLANGIYYHQDTIIGAVRLCGLFLIQHIYPYQNEYLKNDFNASFSVPSETSVEFFPGTYNVQSGEEFLFSIELPILPDPGIWPVLIMLALYAVAFLALCAAIFQLYLRFEHLLKYRLLLILAYCIDVVLIRLLMFWFGVPRNLHDTYIFNPSSFAASDLIPSMGDFLFNALTLLVISYALFVTYRNISLKKDISVFRRYFLVFSLFLHIFIFYRLLLWAVNSLIMDSAYSLNLNQIFFLSADSFLGLIVLTILLFSFFLVSYRILGLAFHYCRRNLFSYLLFFIITSSIYGLICIFVHKCELWLFLPLFFYVVAFYFQASPPASLNRIGFSSSVLYLFLFAILGTALLSTYNADKEKEQRRLLAIDLASGEDPLTEYILQSVVREMREDTELIYLLSEAPYGLKQEDAAIAYIEDNYLSDRLRKYEWMVTLCTPSRNLEILPDGYVVNCKAYFHEIISKISQPALGNALYSYDNEAGICNYISMQDYILNNGHDSITVYIELFSFFIPEEGLGYPELLIDDEIRTFAGLENYSYARYIKDELVFKYGDYAYRTNLSKYGSIDNASFFDHNNTNHYISRIDEQEYLIISRETAGLLDFLAPFSYLIVFFAVFVLIFLAAVNIPFTPIEFELNFRNQLQLYIITLIIISFVIVGIITINYVIGLNTEKNKEILEEKTHSVLIELEHKLSGEERLTVDMNDYLTSLLIKFSKVFFSDINLYDLQGNLLASSRPLIFSKQLISDKMNADAFRTLTYDKKLLFIHTEAIGDMEYYSAYIPFRNTENKVVAYLNLPYFARQTELQNEISVFLNAFLNVYVLMIAVAIFIAILISRYITRPLQLIRDKLRGVSLGNINEKIQWSGKDEIGTLVAEYNRMIDELARSADMLAKSERESAWREMAKQVAHEIKNPLTPMKLSVQYLQKAWDEKSDDWEERLRRFTRTIIEHIDTLSSIASEFSDFAKMPQKKDTRLNLSDVINKSIDLYSDTENIQFSFNAVPDPPYYVMADKNQLIRVFTNLIQNAVQAIGKDIGGNIAIKLEKDDGEYVISVADNGPGIPDDMMDKIFSPSFTTKSSGMGLGLALVRSIIVEAGGSISFESSPDNGTIFIIRLQVYK